MLYNSWNNVTLVCGNHGDDLSHIMELFEWTDSKRDAVFYRCPQYQVRYGKVQGQFCDNRLTIEDYMAMLRHLQEMAQDGVETVNLKGLHWTNKGIQYKVLEDKHGQYVVSVLNKKALS